MGNKIDLSKYNIRTDLIVDIIENSDINVEKERFNDINVTRIDITNELSKKINKKEGKYITIEFDDVTNYEDRERIGKCFEEEIKRILKELDIKEDDECLIVGLGNEKSTPDALGPNTIRDIVVTRHLFELNTNVEDGIRKVSVCIPDVMGNTGIETCDVINAIVNVVKPKFLITIDALASSSINRLNKTIQMTDTGIHPGSGVGNTRKEISKKTIGIPVIAIGVPTVVETSIVVNDTIKYLFKHISYLKNNIEKSKLTYTKFGNYIDKINNSDLSSEEKKEILGMLGELSEEDKLNLINEVLNSINYNLMVTPKEIDYLILKLSEIIANSLNNALHRQISHY